MPSGNISEKLGVVLRSDNLHQGDRAMTKRGRAQHVTEYRCWQHRYFLPTFAGGVDRLSPQKRKRPRLRFESWDVRRTALPRSLLTNNSIV